jgi:hypothetical protein
MVLLDGNPAIGLIPSSPTTSVQVNGATVELSPLAADHGNSTFTGYVNGREVFGAPGLPSQNHHK